jgi:hypothetical protein
MRRAAKITSSLAASAALLAAGEARADVMLGADVALGVPVDQAPQRFLSTGGGFDLRGGYRFRVPYLGVAITPEIAAGYTDLGTHLVRVRPGLRVGFGRILTPYAYGHVGWAFTSFDPLGEKDTAGTATWRSTHGLCFDAGAGLDVAILKRLSVGAHLGYNVVNVDAGTTAFHAKWMSFGLNAGVYF